MVHLTSQGGGLASHGHGLREIGHLTPKALRLITCAIRAESWQLTQDSPNPENSDQTPAPAPVVDIDRLTTAVTDAQAKLAEGMAEVTRLMASGDVAGTLKQGRLIEGLEKDVTRAQSALERGLYDARRDERMAASVELKAAVEKFANGLKLPKFTELGLKGFSVVFNKDDNSFNVSIGEPAAVKAPSAGGGSGESKPRAMWDAPFLGTKFSSRELLLAHGGEAGEKAIDRAENWRLPKWGPNGDTPMSAGPGFDAAVKSLARSMGWNGGDDRVLTHLPA